MPRISSEAEPKGVRPFRFHGIHLEYRDGDSQAMGDCPACGREGKLSVEMSEGRWRCFVCGEKGNPLTFLRWLHEESMKTTTDEDLEELAVDRGILRVESLRAWGVCRSAVSGEWLVPGYGMDGDIDQVYKYSSRRDGGRRIMLATPGIHHAIHGVPTYNQSCSTVLVCEGVWDGIALWETLGSTDGTPMAILGEQSVLAVPGCQGFRVDWCRLLGGRRVVMLFDSDHPRSQDGGLVAPPAGMAGVLGAVEVMSRAQAQDRPSEVRYLAWGPDGYDPDRPSGWDLRDSLIVSSSLEDRLDAWVSLQELIAPVPGTWAGGAAEDGSVDVAILPCREWDVLVDSARKALKWPEDGVGLDYALSVMMAVVATTPSCGDQLWVKIIGPPSSGKSTLCEAISTARRWVYPKDTLTGLFSGFQSDREGTENQSLAGKIQGKTLVIKDGDTVIQAPNRAQILSQFRALYDRSVRVSYGNRMSKDWEGMSVTVLLCGTQSIRVMESELGERYLDCVVADEVDEETEEEIGWRVANQAAREMSLEASGSADSREGPEMVEFKRLAGGFVDWLRTNAMSMYDQVEFPDGELQACMRYAQLVAYMRARPSLRQAEKSERELSYRLIKQLVRLAKSLAVVLGVKMVDERVMRRVHRVAMDTARGRTMDLCRHLYQAGEEGALASSLALHTGHDSKEELALLKFLKRIGATDIFEHVMPGHVIPTRKWQLTDKIRRLWEDVVR